MKLYFLTIFCSLFFILYASANFYYSQAFSLRPDTIPPPPPGQAVPLTGPISVCVGETSEYSVDVPVSCICQWEINGIIQPDTTSPFIITWTQSGLQVVAVIFICAGGQTSDPETLTVLVYDSPSQPGPISGDSFVCEYTFHSYSTSVGPYDSCEWKVNGVVQPGYLPVISYTFGGSGTYGFEVTAFNPCGTSIPQTLEVTAQGSAPDPPSPVQGPGESCEGNTEIYATSVGPGESCEWRIDGVVQTSTAATLEVTWNVRGDHLIEVRAVSDCGTGNPAFKDVTVMYQPDVFLGNDTTILQGQTLLLDAGNPGCDYLWSTGETNRSITINSTGTYSVNVSNFCGDDTDTIEVTVLVSIVDFVNPGDCFDIIIQDKKISFPDLSDKDLLKIMIISLSGIIYYDGPPVSEISVSRSGIYLIRLTLKKSICYQKIFIP